MKRLTFRLIEKQKETEEDYERSKFFGSPAFPTDFLEKNDLQDDLFLCQINLSEINTEGLLPNTGMLYFFLTEDATYQAKVIYSNEELTECCYMINDGFEESDNWNALMMEFVETDIENYIMSEVSEDDNKIMAIDTTNKFILLAIDPLDTPSSFPFLGCYDGYYYFIIDKDDLKKLNFSNVLFINTEE